MTNEEKILERIDEAIAALQESIVEANQQNIDIDLSMEALFVLGSQFRQYNITYGASRRLRSPVPYITYTGGR